MSIEELYEIYTKYPSVTTDSRKIGKGDLFFALKGPNFNGNQYAGQALLDGAAYAVVDEPVTTDKAYSGRIIQVEDVLGTLQQLAGFHRQTFDIPFIAITGSNGKTTTKELVHTVLSQSYKTYTTKGNLNNHIGIPLTILSIKKDADIAVIEMGANHLREIAGYCAYTRPTIGLITNCGKAHLEGFGGEAGVRKGKGELFDYLRAHNGISFSFADYPYFTDMTRGIERQFWYSESATCNKPNLMAAGTVYQSDPFLQIKLQALHKADRIIKTQLVGAYNLPNVLAAIALGRYFDIADERIEQAIAAYAPSNSRSQMIQKDSNQIILDAYNANPSSMQAAIQNFARMQGDHKVLILGGMKELGQDSEAEHLKLKSLIEQTGGWQKVLLIGPEFMHLAAGAGTVYSWFKDQAAAADFLRDRPFTGSHILVKGSRSNQLEKLVAFL